MAFPLLLLPLIGAAAGLGTQAARGKTGNDDLWKGALLGAGAGLGGAGLGAAGGMGTMMGGAAAGGAGTGAASGAAGAGAGAGGFNALLGAAGKGAATTAGSTAAARLLSPEEEMVATQYGMVPPMMQQQDPMALFAQLQSMSKGGMS